MFVVIKDRENFRHGYKSETVSTTCGQIEWQIPELRPGRASRALLKRRQRIDPAYTW
ncbi:transposase [Rhodococcoides trifolii]|uniref:transposase n=1 Tax=Rhodococcoides trifolii TaxID=908250 RepID=UPI003530212F